MSILISEITFLISKKRKPSHEKLPVIAKIPAITRDFAGRIEELRLARQTYFQFDILIT